MNSLNLVHFVKSLRFNSRNFSKAVANQSTNTSICSSYRIVLPIISSRTFSDKVLKKLPLHDFHEKHGAKFVEFAGYQMPSQYAGTSIIQSHLHTREHCSIFDVSHMNQMCLKGKDCIKFIETLVVSDIAGLDEDLGTLTVMTNEKGGIIDDMIINRVNDKKLYIVSNAACADKVISHLKKNILEFNNKGGEVTLELLPLVLLAIQGPWSPRTVEAIVGYNMDYLYFMQTSDKDTCDDIRITRCGYTGEDGFELSMSAECLPENLDNILKDSDWGKLAGLGARDTLRLEAGLCLYGQDMDEDTTPVEAGLAWTISKRRRIEGGFPGADIILSQLKKKPQRKRVGIISQGACPRSGAEILNEKGEKVGKVTSGCFSPCLEKNISMGYVESTYANIGTHLNFIIHQKEVKGTVTKMPFVPTRYAGRDHTTW